MNKVIVDSEYDQFIDHNKLIGLLKKFLSDAVYS